jgi:5-methylcytosine-specific restriction endonuclease McrA
MKPVQLTELEHVPPTVAEMEAERRGKPLWKGKTRLEEVVEARPLTTMTEQQFKTAVWIRDKHHCRCCGRKVEKILGRVPERGEVNHIHGRTGDLRFEVRAAILMCLTCHERFTGRVNQHRLQIIASATFTIRQGTFTDATYPVTFKEVA